MKAEKETTPQVVEEVQGEPVSAQEHQAPSMPRPVTMNYEQKYQLSDLFIEHLRLSLKDAVCNVASPFYNYALANKDAISQADLQEFVKKIETSFTFGQVGDLMRNIGTADGQAAYFIPIQSEEDNAEQA